MNKNDDSANDTKYSLQRLHAYFNEQARVIRSALDLIESLETTVAKKDREIAALKNATTHARLLARLENTKVTFLIDGSSSMGVKIVGQRHSLLETALENVQQFHLASGQNKISAHLFGNTSGTLPIDLSDSAIIEKIKKDGLRCGTELNPSLTGLVPGKKKEHLLIIGDGDINNVQAVQKTLEEMLAKNKNLSIDFIVILNRPNSDMKKLQEAITVSDQARKPRLILADHRQGQGAVMSAIMHTLESRTAQKNRPSRKTPVLKSA